MSPTRRRTVVAGLLAAAAISFAAGCGGDDDEPTAAATTAATAPATTAPDTTPTAPADTSGTGTTAGSQEEQYVADASAAAQALEAFGTVLQSTSSLEDFRGRVGDARKTIADFDGAVKKLQGYTLDNPTLEEQRAGLARTGPAVTDVLNRFVDTAQTGSEDDLRALVPDIQKAIGDFRSAAATAAPSTTAP